MSFAKEFVGKIDNKDIQHKYKDDLIKFNSPSGKNKAIISSVANILRPAKALQVSIQDNKWISEKTHSLKDIKQIIDFIENLAGLRFTEGK